MVTGKELQNKALISVTDGKKVGEIKDLYLDADATKVTAVFVGKEGIVRQKTWVIERSAIQVCGIDVWLVSGSDKIVNLDDVAGSQTFILGNDLRGREIHTQGGSKIGTLGDLVLDGEARVVGFTLGKTYVQGALAEKKGIVRSALLNLGSKDTPAIVDLPKAEASELPE
jgi:sporulation protein YlmC with PRC-barrel domain